jgi:hypothetical protein
MDFLTRTYTRGLDLAIRWHWITVGMALASLGGVWLLARGIGWNSCRISMRRDMGAGRSRRVRVLRGFAL